MSDCFGEVSLIFRGHSIITFALIGGESIYRNTNLSEQRRNGWGGGGVSYQWKLLHIISFNEIPSP